MPLRTRTGTFALHALVVALTVATAAGVPSAATAAPVAPAASADAVGRYIVLLRRDRATVQGLNATVTSLAGGRVGRVFGNGVPGFTASLSAAEARRIAADPSVAVVEQDRRVRVSGVQRSAPWSLDRVDGRSRKLSGTYLPSDTAAGVHAYVIDTGIRISHREFGGRASYGYDFVGNDTSAGDCHGHGTHVAATLGGSRYGVAKKVRLVAVRVLDCTGSGWNSDVIAGVDWVTEHAQHPAVANMSLGGEYSAAIDEAVKRSIDSGVTYVVAAGNEDDNAAHGSPAGVPAAITVGATDRRDRRASFSNYGPIVDIFAPGVGITSAGRRSDTATAVMSGTSMASPLVTGAAAMILAAHPTWRPGDVRSRLVAVATTGRVRDRAGSPNRILYVPRPPAATTVATRSLPAALEYQPYSVQLRPASGRTGTWGLAAGTLPAGLRLSTRGLLSGTPTSAVSRRIVVRFTDYVPQTVTRTLTLTVRPSAPRIATGALPAGTVGEAYAATLATTDLRPGDWSIIAGALPAGLAMDTTGLISGTPAEAADTAVTVRFVDQQGRVTTAVLTVSIG
ncbi:S8 family peptidase [Actinoplanes sp. NPDC026623]|uniref:S8 family peptidase n=1 Tax=Actinoplanes sp. NPDC026623 TaxID=3155610 RepID=UPI0033DF6008